MFRIKLSIAYDRRLRIGLIIGIFLSLLAFDSSILFDPPTRVQASPDATFIPIGGGRHFYLTEANHAIDEVLTACASGYHMASLWEILDVSNLTYDYDHPAAHTKADSGHGPPSYWYGWVRTGFFSSGSTTAGAGNCQNWSDTTAANSGVSVRLSRTWVSAPGDISTWDATSFTCNFSGPVWCAGDFNVSYLPVTMKGP